MTRMSESNGNTKRSTCNHQHAVRACCLCNNHNQQTQIFNTFVDSAVTEHIIDASCDTLWALHHSHAAYHNISQHLCMVEINQFQINRDGRRTGLSAARHSDLFRWLSHFTMFIKNYITTKVSKGPQQVSYVQILHSYVSWFSCILCRYFIIELMLVVFYISNNIAFSLYHKSDMLVVFPA